MLEYLLSNPLRLRTSNSQFVYTLNGRELTLSCDESILDVCTLPVHCVGLHKDSCLGGGVFLLGYDGRIYHVRVREPMKVYDQWPIDLTPYLLK